MKTSVALFAFLAFGPVGCKAVQAVETKLDSLSDAQLAAYLQEGASFAAQYGIGAAQAKFPNNAARILTDAKNVDTVIRTVVLPALQGAPTGQVVTATIAQVTALMQNTTLEKLDVMVNAVVPSLPLPTNPADKLSPRAQAAAIGFFTGVAEGIEKKAGLTPPPVPTPAPLPPPPAPSK